MRTTVTPSGVYVCPYWRGKRDFKIGDVNLDSFDSGLDSAHATNCTQSGSTWNCYYELTDVSDLTNGDILTIGVHPNSQDDAGNPVVVPETVDRSVKVDLEAPILWGNIN